MIGTLAWTLAGILLIYVCIRIAAWYMDRLADIFDSRAQESRVDALDVARIGDAVMEDAEVEMLERLLFRGSVGGEAMKFRLVTSIGRHSVDQDQTRAAAHVSLLGDDARETHRNVYALRAPERRDEIAARLARYPVPRGRVDNVTYLSPRTASPEPPTLPAA